MQFYINPKARHEPFAQPSGETFYVSGAECIVAAYGDDQDSWLSEVLANHDGPVTDYEGWYWWHCRPGCLPDGEPSGPFQTEAAAIEDAQEMYLVVRSLS
jgi:hypothetical protein